MNEPAPPTYPARPTDGGPFDKAGAKIGEWTYEPKYNGWRSLIHIPTGRMFNRQGQHLTIEAEFVPALNKLKRTLDCALVKWADCEALERRHDIGRGTLILLDVIPEERNLDGTPYTYEQRRCWFPDSLIPPHRPSTKPEPDALYQSWRIHTMDALNYWHDLQQHNATFGCPFYEGLVAKRDNSHYPIQLRSPNQKFPFWVKHRWAY